ncbi:MAG: hypothetical protein ACYCV0_20000, partial [Desulfitobacteriaceae bacterium]
NALSGKFFSGANRDQQFNVLLAQKQAEQGINNAQNQFNTGITNRLSDADAQRVAALNDIAEKLRLTEQQYNQGTLDLTNQIESEKAAGAARTLADSMKWAQDVQDRGVDNSLRRGQLDLSRDIFNRGEVWKEKTFGADQAWREKTFGADQDNAAFQRALALAGLTGVYDGQPTLDARQLAASQARSSAPKAPTATRQKNNNLADAYEWVSNYANKGYGMQSALAQLQQNASEFLRDGIDPNEVEDMIYKKYTGVSKKDYLGGKSDTNAMRSFSD